MVEGYFLQRHGMSMACALMVCTVSAQAQSIKVERIDSTLDLYLSTQNQPNPKKIETERPVVRGERPLDSQAEVLNLHKRDSEPVKTGAVRPSDLRAGEERLRQDDGQQATRETQLSAKRSDSMASGVSSKTCLQWFEGLQESALISQSEVAFNDEGRLMGVKGRISLPELFGSLPGVSKFSTDAYWSGAYVECWDTNAMQWNASTWGARPQSAQEYAQWAGKKMLRQGRFNVHSLQRPELWGTQGFKKIDQSKEHVHMTWYQLSQNLLIVSDMQLTYGSENKNAVKVGALLERFTQKSDQLAQNFKSSLGSTPNTTSSAPAPVPAISVPASPSSSATETLFIR